MVTLSPPVVKKDVSVLERRLLPCSPIASLLYVTATILGAMIWNGYSSFSQEGSELFAVDAPSRSLVVALFLASSVLMIAFAVGVWRSAQCSRVRPTHCGSPDGHRSSVRHSRHRRDALCPDALAWGSGLEYRFWHIILTIATMLLILLILGFGAAAEGSRFLLYSIIPSYRL